MGTLRNCIKKAGKLIKPADADALHERARQYVADGHSAAKGEEMAIMEAIDEAMGQLESVYQQAGRRRAAADKPKAAPKPQAQKAAPAPKPEPKAVEAPAPAEPPAAPAEPLPPAQMKRPALRAELAAAGVQSVSGVPLDDANAAQLMAAVGKLRRGQLETPGASATPDERADKVARIKELNAQAKALSDKGGLTKSEAAAFKRLMGEANSLRFDIAKPLTLDKIPSAAERQSTLPSEIVLIARNDLMRNKKIYTPIVDAAIGVGYNADTAVDDVMAGKNPDVTPKQFYDAFSATRKALRQHYGDTITLYRATGSQKEKPTTNWATTREFAQSFGDNIVKRDVPVDDVVAVNVGPNGKYHEIIVGRAPDAATPTSDKLLQRLESAKKRKTDELRGKAFAATEGVYRAAEIAALDIAILAVRAGRPIEQAVRMAIARFKARYPAATPDELSQAEASIRGAINEPPPPPKATAPEDGDKRVSKVGPSMRKAGAPIEDMEYDARAQDERMKEAQAIVTKDGPEKAEAAIENPDIAPDTRVAIGGTLVRDKMLDIANAKPEEIAALTRDMNRIVRKMRPELATKAGQTVAMWGGIYRDISVASGIEYLRDAQKKMDDALGGKDAQDAIDGATAALDKDMTAAEIEAEIERLKKKYTTKPARKVLTALQKQGERVQKLRKLGALQREDLADLVGKELGIPTPSPEQMKRIAEIADRIKNAPTHAERSKAELDLADQLAVYKGVAAMDVLSSMMTAGVLSGYTTQFANLQGTALNMLFNIGTTAVANPSKLKPIIEGLVRGVPLGIDQFKAIWKTGVGTRDLQDKTGGAGSPLSRVDFERDFGIPGAAGKAATGSARISERVFRFMRAVDASFYYPAREAYATLAATKLLEGEYKGAELAQRVRATLQVAPEAFLRARQQAASEGYTGVDLGRRVADIIEAKRQEDPVGLQAVKESEQFAAESTFTNEPVGLAGVAYRAMRNLVENAKVAGVPILKPWLMFLKTPANVFNAVTNYTPAGFVRSQFGMMGTSPGKENRRNFTADERAQLNIKAAIGTTLMSTLLIGLMDDEDIEISGKGPQDAGKRRQMQDRGWIPYSIRVGDKYISYKDSPLLLPLAIVGNARDSVKYQKPKSDLVLGNQYADAMLKSGTTIFDLSMLTGLGDLLSAMRNSDMKGVSRTLASVPANTAIPLNRLLQQIDQTFDDQSYEVNPLVGSIPFARRTGEPKTDVLGRPTTYAPTKRFISSEREGPLDAVLREKGLFVSEPSKETKIGNRVMTDEEYKKYRQISGQRIRVRLENIVPRLKIMTKEKAEKEIDRIEREERERAKRAVVIGAAAPKR